MRRMTALHDGKSGTADDRRAEDSLVEALDRDMRDWWQPTEASYFGRVPIDYGKAYKIAQERLEYMENFYKNNE